METCDANSAGIRRRVVKVFFGVSAAVLLSALLILLYLFNPLTSAIFPPCPVNYLTGFHCPGCGSLRAIHLLLHGDIAGALAMNSLLVLFIALFPIALFRRSWLYLSSVPWIILIIVLLFGMLRNIHMWPFCLLAPH